MSQTCHILHLYGYLYTLFQRYYFFIQQTLLKKNEMKATAAPNGENCIKNQLERRLYGNTYRTLKIIPTNYIY